MKYCEENVLVEKVPSCLTESLIIRTGNTNEVHNIELVMHSGVKKGMKVVQLTKTSSNDVNGDVTLLISDLPEAYINSYSSFNVKVFDENGVEKEVGTTQRVTKFSVFPFHTYVRVNNYLLEI